MTRYRWNMDMISSGMLFFLVIIFFSAWAIILRIGGLYFTQCKKTIASWKYFNWSMCDKKIIKKFAKSCRPLKIGDQTYFKFNNATLPNFIKGLTRGYFRVMLTIA